MSTHREVNCWSKCHCTAHIKARTNTQNGRLEESLAGRKCHCAAHIKARTYTCTVTLMTTVPSDVWSRFEVRKEGMPFPHFFFKLRLLSYSNALSEIHSDGTCTKVAECQCMSRNGSNVPIKLQTLGLIFAAQTPSDL